MTPKDSTGGNGANGDGKEKLCFLCYLLFETLRIFAFEK